jgi:hypothetical protein
VRALAVTPLATAALVGLLLPVSVLADHGAGGGSAAGVGPLAVALMWGGAAFVVGMLIVAVIARLTRRPPPDDGDTA